MAKQETRVLDALKRDPQLSQQELAELLGMSRNAVAGHITRLMRKGNILGKGYIFPSSEEWLVIGGSNLDCQGTTTHDIVGADSFPGSVSESAGGVGRNIAENLSRLGLKTRLISAIGRDRPGDWLIEHCQNAGIITENILRINNEPTSRYLAITDRDGLLKLAIADMAILQHIDASMLGALNLDFSQAKGIVVDTNLSNSALDYLFSLSNSANYYVDAVSQVKALKLLPWINQIHTLKLNQTEATALLGSKFSPNQAAAELVKLGVKQVLLSIGKKGVIYSDNTGTTHFEASSIDVVSDTGAGDALFSGFIAAESRGFPLDAKIRFAQSCAEITLMYSGANHPGLTFSKVESCL